MDLITDLPGLAKYVGAASAGAAALYLLYRSILPKPLPGIPYNPEALRSPLGDIPGLVKEVVRTRQFMGWLSGQLARHDAPVVQVFILFPFWKPVVVVGDVREVHDICVRRTPREFDRSVALARILVDALAPDHHIAKPTPDATWRSRRRLLQDLMMPAFLRGVVSPAIYDKATDLVRLWEMRCLLGQGRTFEAAGDTYHTALDALLVFSYGDRFTHGSLAASLARLEAMTDEERAAVVENVPDDGVVKFPAPTLHPIVETINTLTQAIEQVRASPIKSLKWFQLKQTTLKEPIARKNKFIRDEILSAMERRQGDSDEWVKSGLDLIVAREARAAAKEGREPEYLSDGIRDEVFGFTAAGHESTTATLSWALKYLTAYQSAQTKLRAALREAMPAAHMEGRQPTNAEVQDASCTYLDAVIEEIMRCAHSVRFTSRDTVQDVDVLGHRIPKGTICWLSQHGQGVLGPHVGNGRNDEKRSETGPLATKAAAGRTAPPAWDEADMADFVPERWIDEKGAFDAASGPSLPFGAGIRGCSGKRLALIEIRTVIVLLFWRFSFEPCPEELSGFGGIDSLAHRPAKCYVRLKPAY